VAYRAATRIVLGVGDLMQRIEDDKAQIGYSVVKRSGDQVIFCTICTVHKEMRSAGLFVWPQNQG
jgi:hypothetical protein